MRKTFASFLLASMLSTPQTVFAAGFANYTLGADEVGGPSYAHASSPSAAFWNPALLTELEGTQVQIGAGVFIPRRELVSATTGSTSETRPATLVVPHAYLSHSISDRLSVGLHANSPFGLESEWEAGWEGRYVSLKSSTVGREAGLNLAYRLAPGISLGGGLRYVAVDAVFMQAVPLPFGLPDATQRFSGDQARLLWQFGAAAELAPGLRLGAQYRSGARYHLDGTVEFSGIPGLLRPAMPDTQARVRITIPAQIFGGITFERGDLLVEAGVRWEQWSEYRELVIELAQPVNGLTRIVQDKHWQDTLAGLLGIRYRLRPDLDLRLGYIYEPSAVPDETLDFSVIDSEKQFLTAGLQWAPWNLTSFSLAYTHGIYEDRNKLNNVGAALGAPANGEIRQGLEMISLSLTHRF